MSPLSLSLPLRPSLRPPSIQPSAQPPVRAGDGRTYITCTPDRPPCAAVTRSTSRSEVDKEPLSEMTSTISGVQSAVTVWCLLCFSYEHQMNFQVFYLHTRRQKHICLSNSHNILVAVSPLCYLGVIASKPSFSRPRFQCLDQLS